MLPTMCVGVQGGGKWEFLKSKWGGGRKSFLLWYPGLQASMAKMVSGQGQKVVRQMPLLGLVVAFVVLAVVFVLVLVSYSCFLTRTPSLKPP